MSIRNTGKCKVKRPSPMIVSKIKKCKDGNEEPIQPNPFFGEPHNIFGQFTYNTSITFDILVLVTIGVQLYLYIKYFNDPTAVEMLGFNLLNIFFCVFGRFVWGILQEKVVPFNFLNLRKTKTKSTDKTTGADLFLALAMFLIVVFTQQIRFLRLYVNDFDQFLFYVFAAPGEEAFFRYFLTAAIIVVTAKIIEVIMRRDVKRWEEITLKASSGFVVGIIFGLAHAGRYSDADLLVILLNGIQFSVAYAFVRRIDFVLLAHLGLNVRAGFDIFI